jgi:protein-tyrosine kinase
MGKIFDALEKSGTKKARTAPVTSKVGSGKVRTAPVTAKVRKGYRAKKTKKNVVSLVRSDRSSHGFHLDETLIAYHAPQSVEAELFKTLRTGILFPASGGQPPKTILITSALPGDGKSYVTSNLAISIAQGVEEHVLLIDGDIRRPSIHQRFGFDHVAGLSDYLVEGADLAPMLLKTPIDKLSILPSGDPPPNPTELMSSKKMKVLVEEVKSRYDDRFILIDSPPPSMASETNAISQYVDGVIIVARAGKTPRDAIADTIEQIGREKLIGMVLNQADRSSMKYYGYEKSYYRT